MKRIALPLFAAILTCAMMTAPAFAGADALYKACKGCHGTDGTKAALGIGAALKGQAADMLEKKMLGYIDGSYGGAKKAIMKNALKRFTPEQIKMLSEFISNF